MSHRSYKTSIVIPVHGKFVLLNNLLSGLLKHEGHNIDEVVVVDDASNDPELDEGLGEWMQNRGLNLKIISISKNVGFTLASNVGLKGVTGEMAERRIVFLISNDVSIDGNFIDQSAEILLSPKRALVGNRHISFDSGWNKFDGKIFDYLEGWFLACTSDGWRGLNYFDENYAPLDYEDVDLSTSAKANGYKLVSLNNPLIRHLGAGTYGYTAERKNITEHNREYFKGKWIKDD